ncbi:hypothetical protein Tco_1257725, partial [Tanacetum coccineum]
IMEYLVKISKKAHILELKRRHLKITILASNTPYPSRKIRRIYACTSLKTTKEQDPIRRIQRRPIRRIHVMEIKYSGRYRTWSLLQETPNTLYRSLSIRRIDLIPDLINRKPKNRRDNPNITMEEYIRLEEEKARQHGTVYNWETAKYGKICSLNNNEIDFRISFDESDDEEYMPKISCFDDLDFFKDFENEFPANVYNDALTSKSDFLTEPTLSPLHIDEFDLKDETSLSEYDEVEQNLSRGNENTQGLKMLLKASHDKINKIFIMESFVMELDVNITAWNYLNNGMLLKAKVEGYTKEIMRQDLAKRLRMVYTEDDGQEILVSHAWMRLFEIRAPLVHEFILEFFSTCRISSEMGLDVVDALCF